MQKFWENFFPFATTVWITILQMGFVNATLARKIKASALKVGAMIAVLYPNESLPIEKAKKSMEQAKALAFESGGE